MLTWALLLCVSSASDPYVKVSISVSYSDPYLNVSISVSVKRDARKICTDANFC